MKFKHLIIPDGWETYWTKYPQGMTILESLFQWVNQVDNMVDNQNKLNDNVAQFRNEIDAFVDRFDKRLQTEVTQTLADWQNSGFLDVVISDALQWELDNYKTTNEQDKLSLTTQLQQHGINVKEFGAVGDGVHDDTLAIQSAIDYCLTQATTPIGSLGGGYPPLFLPAGRYKVTDSLKITNTNGFTVMGSGQQATQIVLTTDSKSLFEITSYLNFSMSFLTLFAGNLDNINGNIVYSYKSSKTNVCFDFNSTNSGAGMTETNVTHAGFKTVYQSKKSTVNGDNHTYRSCQYLNNACVWDNTNAQAVIWSFYDCKAYYNDDIFINPATFLFVRGGDWINKGTFLTGNLTNTTSDLIFDGLRFENYQNIDPTSNPKLLNLANISGSILFKNCKARGGGSLADKVTGTIVGLWNIKCVNCFLQGIWDVNASTSSDGLTSSLTFESCTGAPRINQILSASQSNKPINLRYTDHAIGTIGRVDRNYYGMLPTNTTSVPANQMVDVTSFLGTISFNTLSKKIPVFNVAPYQLRVYEVNLTFMNNTPNPPKLTLWTSEEKTTKVFEQTLPVLNGEWQFIKIPSNVMNTHNITGYGNVLFLEISSEANSGTCRFTMEITYKQVN